ncbi:MAG: hypothetical protein MZW92_32885 [Comamonadaceae bacterium]|nr:hypothetical protein [Comamonadaceae bacterium]
MRKPVVGLQAEREPRRRCRAPDRVMACTPRPIVDEADRVLGIVTTTDIMRSLLHGPPRKGDRARRRAAPSQPPTRRRPAKSRSTIASRPTRSIATALRTADDRCTSRHAIRGYLGQDDAVPRRAPPLPRESARAGRPLPAHRAGRADALAVAEGDPRRQARRGVRHGQGARAVPAASDVAR